MKVITVFVSIFVITSMNSGFAVKCSLFVCYVASCEPAELCLWRNGNVSQSVGGSDWLRTLTLTVLVFRSFLPLLAHRLPEPVA